MYHIPRTYLTIGSLYLLATFTHFLHCLSLTSGNHNLYSVSLVFFQIPHISEIIQHLPFFVWLISPSIMCSKSIHVVSNGRISFHWMTLSRGTACLNYMSIRSLRMQCWNRDLRQKQGDHGSGLGQNAASGGGEKRSDSWYIFERRVSRFCWWNILHLCKRWVMVYFLCKIVADVISGTWRTL